MTVLPLNSRRQARPRLAERTPTGDVAPVSLRAIRNEWEKQDSEGPPLAADSGMIAFSAVDERFIDYLVEEAVREWRAKNF